MVREGDSGFNVRGGNSDQNLVLLDEAPVYNAFHFFGFFSVFNSDAIKNVKLIKGPAPAKYGGKLSSVLDIQMNEGNLKEFRGNGGIGTIFSRLTLEGPIKTGISSYIISSRRTYADVFTHLFGNNEVKNSSLYFYDFNLKTNYRLSEIDRLFISGYFGQDVLGYSGIFRNTWGNKTATIRWNHIFSDKLFLNSSAIYSNFNYGVKVEPEEDSQDDETVELENNINAFTLAEDFQYFLNAENTLNFGLQYVFYNFLPGKLTVTGDSPFNLTAGKRKARNISFYAAHEFEASTRMKINYGLRYSYFPADRVKDTYDFSQINDPPLIEFQGNEQITYRGVEPRITVNYKLNELSSVKLGYARN
ncbi:MAG: TonB-dependent receptor plug domain-containing protein, partial [Calditrichia bacterium]